MTNQEILDAISANPQLQALADENAFGPLSVALSAGRTQIASHYASERGILERFPSGPLAADALLSKLDAFSATNQPMASIVKRALKFLAQTEGLDLGSPATQDLLVALASAGIITTAERDGIRSMATVPAPVTAAEIEIALRG